MRDICFQLETYKMRGYENIGVEVVGFLMRRN